MESMDRWIEVNCDLGIGELNFKSFIVYEMFDKGLFIFIKYFRKDFDEMRILSDTLINFYLE